MAGDARVVPQATIPNQSNNQLACIGVTFRRAPTLTSRFVAIWLTVRNKTKTRKSNIVYCTDDRGSRSGFLPTVHRRDCRKLLSRCRKFSSDVSDETMLSGLGAESSSLGGTDGSS